MMKGKAVSTAAGLGIALSVFCLLESLFALTMVKGLIPEKQAMLLMTAAMAASAFSGSRFARRRSGRGEALCAGLLFVGLVMLTGFLIYDNVRPVGALAAAIASLGCLLGAGGGKKKRKKRKRTPTH